MSMAAGNTLFKKSANHLVTFECGPFERYKNLAF